MLGVSGLFLFFKDMTPLHLEAKIGIKRVVARPRSVRPVGALFPGFFGVGFSCS